MDDYYKKKIIVDSICPSCKDNYKREVYLQMFMEYPNLVPLDLCKKCCNIDGITLIGNNKLWQDQKTQKIS